MHWSAVGHEEQKGYLQRLLEEGRLPHALLLAGPEGIGKAIIADDLCAALVPPGFSPDRMLLAPTRDQETGKLTNIPIESVREMKHWVRLRPLGAHKAVLVDGADRLGHDAANSLLKILEEPPAYARFILVSSRPHDVVPTIASRCERVQFRPLNNDEMASLLAVHALSPDERALLTSVAAGRPGSALQIIEDKKLPEVAGHIEALETVLKAGVTERLLTAQKIAESDDAQQIVSWWLAYAHASLARRPELAPVAHGLVDLYRTISEPWYNRRLAVEHFLLTL